jgi:FkbM family methyltransferase
VTRLRKLLQGIAGMGWRGKRSYSQFGEDLFVERFFEGTRSGTWLDVGAFHPRIASNTHALRRRGWSGVNVDADPDKMRLFRLLRRRDTNVSAAIAGPDGGRAVLQHIGAGSYGSMDRLQLDAGPDGIPTRTVASVLDDAGIERVTFVSMDVEGLEADILQGFPFERAQPELFCVEVLDWTLDGVQASPVASIMGSHGYQIVGWFPPSVFFAKAPRPADGA